MINNTKGVLNIHLQAEFAGKKNVSYWSIEHTRSFIFATNVFRNQNKLHIHAHYPQLTAKTLQAIQ